MVYFVTGNSGKFLEVKSILREVKQLDLDLVEIQESDSRLVVEAKLVEAIKSCPDKEICIEDTSLYLDCLNGLPGPLIKWFLKCIGVDGIYNIANKFKNYKAFAKTIVGYYDGESMYFFEGVVDGRICSPRGGGFGWDSIFIPKGYDLSFGEMGVDEKSKISMRKIAFNKLKEFLDEK